MGNIAVFVKARPGAAGILVERRCRCGMCFDTVGRTVSVTEDQLALLQADPMLVVTEAPALEADNLVTEEIERVADKVNQIVTDSPALEPISDANIGSAETLPAAAAGAEAPPTPASEAPKVETPAKADKNAAKADKAAAKAAKGAG